jgi:hypothetical protein
LVEQFFVVGVVHRSASDIQNDRNPNLGQTDPRHIGPTWGEGPSGVIPRRHDARIAPDPAVVRNEFQLMSTRCVERDLPRAAINEQ